jgi:hypothetical protein
MPASKVSLPKRLGRGLSAGEGVGAGGGGETFAGFSSGAVCPKFLTMAPLSPEVPALFNLIMFISRFTRRFHRKIRD